MVTKPHENPYKLQIQVIADHMTVKEEKKKLLQVDQEGEEQVTNSKRTLNIHLGEARFIQNWT